MPSSSAYSSSSCSSVTSSAIASCPLCSRSNCLPLTHGAASAATRDAVLSGNCCSVSEAAPSLLHLCSTGGTAFFRATIQSEVALRQWHKAKPHHTLNAPQWMRRSVRSAAAESIQRIKCCTRAHYVTVQIQSSRPQTPCFILYSRPQTPSSCRPKGSSINQAGPRCRTSADNDVVRPIQTERVEYQSSRPTMPHFRRPMMSHLSRPMMSHLWTVPLRWSSPNIQPAKDAAPLPTYSVGHQLCRPMMPS